MAGSACIRALKALRSTIYYHAIVAWLAICHTAPCNQCGICCVAWSTKRWSRVKVIWACLAGRRAIKAGKGVCLLWWAIVCSICASASKSIRERAFPINWLQSVTALATVNSSWELVPLASLAIRGTIVTDDHSRTHNTSIIVSLLSSITQRWRCLWISSSCSTVSSSWWYTRTSSSLLISLLAAATC